MKYFVKAQEPDSFHIWKKQANENWEPTFDNLQNPEKRDVFESLFKEQGHICCYCENRLTLGNCHIDHLIPQSKRTIDPLDYQNFVCSCQNNLSKGSPLHCGNSKKDEELPISPLNPHCESRFKFSNAGKILAANLDDHEALKTIQDILNLNSSNLVDDRLEVIAEIDEEISQYSTYEEISDCVLDYLKKDSDGKYSPH